MVNRMGHVRRFARIAAWVCAISVLFLLSVGGIQQKQYVTEYGLGPDKWATAWYLTKFSHPHAVLRVVDSGAAMLPGEAFDVPSAPVRRLADKAAFEVALAQTPPLDGPQAVRDALTVMARVVHEIEVDFWNADDSPEASAVEDAFRRLQKRYGRDRVPADCYLAFFGRVFDQLLVSRRNHRPIDSPSLEVSCNAPATSGARPPQPVSEVPIDQVLVAMGAGARVLFVDVREPEEFVEGHIPGALNLALREVNESHAARFAHAAYVVSYCVKDFRGFEMAKRLADLGVRNSIIMNPYGIKGWIGLGLPTAGNKALSEADAALALQACLANPRQCRHDAHGRGQ